jgi:starch phosphorylase
LCNDLDTYLRDKTTWFKRAHRDVGAASASSDSDNEARSANLSKDEGLIAYFSAEFGLTECLSIFAGGLGLLAGDHLKSASDLGVPLVGVGLLYQKGYFRQHLNEIGWQQEDYVENDFYSLPLRLEFGADGAPLTVKVPLPGRQVVAQIWRAQVGRIALYLLDTNTVQNARAEDRDITDQLYGGDLENRMKQEILLGIGGYRALEALGLEPLVYHMNEGHSAFSFSRARADSTPYEQARSVVCAGARGSLSRSGFH